MKPAIQSFWREDRAAISPLYAVGILALVAVSGVGFDYGRLMALDSELQNAADQAALAAATQLDGGDDAMTRARDAANNTLASSTSAYVNETRFANDERITGATDTRPITSLGFVFYDGYSGDTVGNEVPYSETDGAQAQVVEVTVNSRQVFYALTPVVGALTSGNVIGKALAALETGTCNVPPMMFCVPEDDNGVAITSFPTDADIGKGLHLHMNANAADPWAPGNFGFLDIDYNITGNPNHTLGLNTSFIGCSGDVIESETGVRDAQADSLNSRLDMFEHSMNNNACDADTGDFCPSVNTGKDFVVTETKAIKVKTSDPVPATPSCGDFDSRDTGWTANSGANSFKKDNCFLGSNPSCAVIGDGVWDYVTYLDAHHPSATAADFGETSLDDVTRYEVYKWESEDTASRLPAQRLSSSYTTKDQGANRTYTFKNVCAYPTPIFGTGIAASDTQKDRRLLTVAAVDCTGLHGSQPVKILRWVDLFLVQPADQNGPDKSFFTEIVGPAKKPNGDAGFQFYGRKKAVLIR